MGILFNILSLSASNLFIAILLTIINVALMFFLIQAWFSNRTLTPISYIVGIILFFLLSFQAILLCGAVTIKSYSDDVENAITHWTQNIPDNVQFNKESSQEILTQINRDWPLVGYFINDADFTGHTKTDIAQSMIQEFRSYMNKFIFRRIGWSLLFVICGSIIVIKTMEKTTRRQRNGSKSSSARHTRRKHYDY